MKKWHVFKYIHTYVFDLDINTHLLPPHRLLAYPKYSYQNRLLDSHLARVCFGWAKKFGNNIGSKFVYNRIGVNAF